MVPEQKKESSPEKRLLEIIEDPVSLKKHNTATRKIFGKLSLGVLKEKLSFFFKSRRSIDSAKRQHFSLRQINLILFVLVGFFLVIFIMNIAIKRSQYNVDERLATASLSRERAVVPPKSILATVEEYVELMKERDIFRPSDAVKQEKKEEEEEEKEEEQKEPTLSELMEGYSLVGIAWSSSPDAMIEDASDKITYFFKEGQSLKNGIKIKKILRDKVILEYKDQEAELE